MCSNYYIFMLKSDNFGTVSETYFFKCMGNSNVYFILEFEIRQYHAILFNLKIIELILC